MSVDDAAATAKSADQRTALDPSTAPQVLAAIAQHRPDLRAAVAMNPATYPTLLEWLAGLDDHVINAALATRIATTPSSTFAPASPTRTSVSRARPQRRTSMLVGMTVGVLVLTGGGYLATRMANSSRSANIATSEQVCESYTRLTQLLGQSVRNSDQTLSSGVNSRTFRSMRELASTAAKYQGEPDLSVEASLLATMGESESVYLRELDQATSAIASLCD